MKLDKTSIILLALGIVVGAIFILIGFNQGASQSNNLTATIAAFPTPVPAATKEPSLRDLQAGKPFVYAGTNMNHPVVKIMELGFVEACLHYDVLCKMVAVDGNDIPGLVAMVDMIPAQGASGMTSFFYDKAFFAPAAGAIKAGIPVINWHSPVDQGDIPGLTAWVSAQPNLYGVEAANLMAKATGCKGTVAITVGSINATEGPLAGFFTAQLQSKCPDMKILDPQEEGFDPPVAIAKAVAILQGTPGITGAFSTTGGGPTTWAKAAEEFGKAKGEIKIISMDTSTVNLDLVKDGSVLAVVAQPLYAENYKSVEILISLLKGEKVAYANPLEAPLVTKDKVAAYYDEANRAAALDITKWFK